jgi:hypothetical protein
MIYLINCAKKITEVAKIIFQPRNITSPLPKKNPKNNEKMT